MADVRGGRLPPLGAGAVRALDELLPGAEFHIRKDPDDPRYEIVTHRRPAGDAAGGPSRPEADREGYHGLDAMHRWTRLVLMECAGVVPELHRKLMRARERFPGTK